MVNIPRDVKGDGNSLAHHHFYGIVVNNEDPEKLQRIKVRIAKLHKDLTDEQLPWVFPATSNVEGNAGGAVGAMGPIPAKGAKVNMKYPDDSMYHGMYFGTVTTKDQKLSDFAGQSGYGADYPNVSGSLDPSGNLNATNHKRDTKEETHVSGTSKQIDAAGNIKVVVNGGYNNPNPDKEVKFPDGSTIEITGNCTLKLSGDMTIEVVKSVKVKTKKDVIVTSTEGDIHFVTEKNIRFHAMEQISFNKASVLAPSPEYPPVAPTAPAAVTARTRPKPADPTNKQDY